MTLYDACKAEGLELDHHESDLYIRATPRAFALVHGSARRYQTFRGSDGGLWIDVPFAYEPFWRTEMEGRA